MQFTKRWHVDHRPSFFASNTDSIIHLSLPRSTSESLGFPLARKFLLEARTVSSIKLNLDESTIEDIPDTLGTATYGSFQGKWKVFLLSLFNFLDIKFNFLFYRIFQTVQRYSFYLYPFDAAN